MAYPVAMESGRHSSVSIPFVPDPEALRRADPRTRERLSEPATRAFLSLVARWNLSVPELQGLLGWLSESTVHKYKSAGKVGTLSYDTLTRISLCLGIYNALHVFFAEPPLADQWVKVANSNVLFGGQAPLTLMIHGGIDGLYQVRRLLEARLQ